MYLIIAVVLIIALFCCSIIITLYLPLWALKIIAVMVIFGFLIKAVPMIERGLRS